MQSMIADNSAEMVCEGYGRKEP